MNFRDFYKKGSPRYSFEVFPPKDEAGMENLLRALRELSGFQPAFISCTYGAMGSTHDFTRDVVIRIKHELQAPPAFHFTCVGSGRDAIRDYVTRLRQEGIDLVVALRGDPPQGDPSFKKPADGFSYANELVGFLKGLDGFSIAVAGYPEGHIEAKDLATDLANLKRKVDAGADIVITQLFFDNGRFYDFVERAKKIGITVPIIPGIMPIINLSQIERITRMCGASLPKQLHQELLATQNDTAQVKEIGIRHATEQCKDLIRSGVPGIHFYTLNQSTSIKRVLSGLI